MFTLSGMGENIACKFFRPTFSCLHNLSSQSTYRTTITISITRAYSCISQYQQLQCRRNTFPLLKYCPSYMQQRQLTLMRRLYKPKRITEEDAHIDAIYRDILVEEHKKHLLADGTRADVVENEHDVQTNSEPFLHLRYIHIVTCQNRWDDIPGGVMFDVAYLDSHPGKDYDMDIPTVVALHGYPGSHEDIRPFLMPLVFKGYRVIAPTFPGCGETRGNSSGDLDVFTHSPGEQAEFISDFLRNLQIPKVDLLICHGSASNAAILLCAVTRYFKSLVAISPLAHNYKRHFFRSWAAYNIQCMYDYTILQPLSFAGAWLYRLFNGLNHYPLTSVISTCRMLDSADFFLTEGSLNTLGLKNYPLLVVNYADSSRSVQADFGEYQKVLLSFATQLPYPKCVQLETGGRASLMPAPDDLVDEIEALLAYTHTLGYSDQEVTQDRSLDEGVDSRDENVEPIRKEI